MNETRTLLIAFLMGAVSLNGCVQDASSNGMPADAGQPMDSGNTDESCTEGFDTGLTDVVRSFENPEAGRYCEVLVVFVQADGGVLIDVYNSLVFGSCPQVLWEQLDVDAIKEEFPDALLVLLNGPRYFVVQHLLDAPTQTNAPVLHDFGGIIMVKAATVTADAPGQASYTPTTVNRDNTWRFEAGHRVHELIDAEGKVYIMQSFSQIIDEDLSYDDLETLGERLEVPEGWRYRTRILDADLDVQADGTATVLQDELQNTYQWRSDCQITE